MALVPGCENMMFLSMLHFLCGALLEHIQFSDFCFFAFSGCFLFSNMCDIWGSRREHCCSLLRLAVVILNSQADNAVYPSSPKVTCMSELMKAG